MAEFVNQRIEDTINELELMQTTKLYNAEEIREISRKRKEFEYRIQRANKQKEDYVHYIAYEMTLLEDIVLRRKQMNLRGKRSDIEYAIANRLNRTFKQFIYRFQNDIEVYFQYIKFCISVGFSSAVSGIIGQMLQVYSHTPRMWQMASKWELEEQKNIEGAKEFLLKGIHRHPESDILYLDLFKIELTLAFQAESDEIKDKQINRANVVWRNGTKNINDLSFLFKICDISILFGVAEELTQTIKAEIWSKRNEKDVWCYIATKELLGHHWEQIEEFVDDDNDLPTVINYFVSIYEEALQKFSDEKLSTRYIHELLSLSGSLCTEVTKMELVKSAWMFCHLHGCLAADMYPFGIQFLQMENQLTSQELNEILDVACKRHHAARDVWEQKLLLNKHDNTVMQSILKETRNCLNTNDQVYLWNQMLDIVESSIVIKNLYPMFRNCESSVLLCIKPKLLQKMYDHCGLKVARDVYGELIRTPPIQLDLQKTMLDIEKSQEKINVKKIKNCYELMVQHHGQNNYDIWMDYMKFECDFGSPASSPAIYRRAISMLDKNIVDKFIKAHALSKLN